MVAAAIGQYRLELADGEWTATFIEETVSVGLGTSGVEVELTRSEEGWIAGGQAVLSEWIHELESGEKYRLTLLGAKWTAAFVKETVSVSLGTSGSEVELTREEGGWTSGGPDRAGAMGPCNAGRRPLSAGTGRRAVGRNILAGNPFGRARPQRHGS